MHDQSIGRHQPQRIIAIRSLKTASPGEFSKIPTQQTLLFPPSVTTIDQLLGVGELATRHDKYLIMDLSSTSCHKIPKC